MAAGEGAAPGVGEVETDMATLNANLVLVCVDASGSSKMALQNAIEVFNAKVHRIVVVMVREPDDAVVLAACERQGVDASLVARADKSLEDEACLAFQRGYMESECPISLFLRDCCILASEAGYAVQPHVVLGTKPAKVISKLANEYEDSIAALVIGHRGLSGLSSLFLGSVASQIVKSVSVPVLLMKHPFASRERRSFAISVELSAKGYPVSLEAFTLVCKLLRSHDEVIFLNVVTDSDEVGDNFAQRQLHDKFNALPGWVREQTGVQNVRTVLRMGDAVEQICLAATELKFDVLCLGHRKRSLAGRIFSLGSVATGCLNADAAAIWIVKR